MIRRDRQQTVPLHGSGQRAARSSELRHTNLRGIKCCFVHVPKKMCRGVRSFCVTVHLSLPGGEAPGESSREGGRVSTEKKQLVPSNPGCTLKAVREKTTPLCTTAPQKRTMRPVTDPHVPSSIYRHYQPMNNEPNCRPVLRYGREYSMLVHLPARALHSVGSHLPRPAAPPATGIKEAHTYRRRAFLNKCAATTISSRRPERTHAPPAGFRQDTNGPPTSCRKD